MLKNTHHRINTSFFEYVFLIALIVLTTFEFFFREGSLILILSLLSIFYLTLTKTTIPNNQCFKLILLVIVFSALLHCFFKEDFNVQKLFISIINALGLASIATICQKSFVKIYLYFIYAICITSTFIYLLCFIPSIKDILFHFALKFPSLNNEIAVNDGGGVNFVIYNFQTLYVDDLIGFSRNCGPFWEPGMFAVYIILGLSLYNFFYKSKIKGFNIILIAALITTVSTGGYIVGLLILFFYIFHSGKKVINKLVYVPIFIFIVVSIISLEYIGEKTLNQLTNLSEGSDSSRFGAMLTQLRMISNSPFVGGENISDYAKGKTLASGTLLPFVNLGIPLGFIFYAIMFYSYRRFSQNTNGCKKYGTILFLLILTLSISQTFLTSGFFECFILNCLLCQNSNQDKSNESFSHF